MSLVVREVLEDLLFMVISLLVQELINFMLGLMLVKHLFLGVIIFRNTLIFGEMHFCYKAIDAGKDSVHFLFNGG